MLETGPYPGLGAVAYLVPALVWTLLARVGWRFDREWRQPATFFRLLAILGALGAANYLFMMVLTIVPIEIHRHPPLLLRVVYVLSDVGLVSIAAVALHLVRHAPARSEPPGARWLAVNYGGVAVIAVLSVFPQLLGVHELEERLRVFFVIRNGYIAIVLALVARHAVRMARRGAWRPGGLGEVRTTDVLLLLAGVAGAFGWVVISMRRSVLTAPSPWLLVYDMAVGLGLAAPLAVRFLGELVPPLLLGLAMLGAASVIHVGARALATIADPSLGPLLDVGTVMAFTIVLVVVPTRLRAAIHRLLFRTSLERRDTLEAFFHALPLELGREECTRRALHELVHVMQLRGAALLPADDGPPIVAGAIEVEPIARIWPRAAAPVFPGGLVEYAFAHLPAHLREALVGAEVMGAIPVTSPRRAWGHLLVRMDFLGATAGTTQLDPVRAFADHLALALDAADVLTRAVAVERSLAHAEKLAAIGELAARIAHEIRNPITAARSLAQQLAREPGAPFAAEHELILAELERVERQVAGLLRFVRRDELRLEAVDLGELVGATVEHFRRRFEELGVSVDVSAGRAISTRADRERMRQVLINLLENALDALGDRPVGRRLVVTVAQTNGKATVRVVDNGSGVAAELLPRLFEPFFSLKPNGTGLGLAIARRTVEAHGGTIAAAPAPEGGLSVSIEVPAR